MAQEPFPGKTDTRTGRTDEEKIMQRDGETALDFDPKDLAASAGVVFIGRIVSPWKERGECPRNMASARDTGRGAHIEIDAPYRPGLSGLEEFSHVAVLTWLDRAPRNLIRQMPRHVEAPRGVFSLRSPARPNPVGLHVVRITHLDQAAGLIDIDAIDVLDGTPVIDLKPYFASIDAFTGARSRRDGDKR